MSHLRQTLKTVLSDVLPRSWLLTRGPRLSLAGVTEIALTFDDGPHPEHTPRLLDTLAAGGATGTFFVIGERAAKHPHLVRRIVDEGHELGNHSWSHSEPAQTSATRFLAEVARTRRCLQDLIGRDCRLTRPPKGALTIRKALGLWRQGQTIALWNADPKDFALRDAESLQKWLDEYRPSPGDIILLHDNHPFASMAVERLANDFDKALRFVRLSQWLSASLTETSMQAEAARDWEVADVR